MDPKFENNDFLFQKTQEWSNRLLNVFLNKDKRLQKSEVDESKSETTRAHDVHWDNNSLRISAKLFFGGSLCSYW